VRIGSKSHDEFMSELNDLNEKIQGKFVEKMKGHTRAVPLKVMLGDATVTEQLTFDPTLVQNYFKEIIQRLDGWTVQDLTITNNEDVRRVFAKFEIKIGNYLLSGHISIQFHVLLYYKTDHRVVDAQKELSELIDRTKEKEATLADESDRFVMNKLKESGYADLDHEKLFEVLFANDDLREKVYSDIHESTDRDFQKMAKKKQDLFNELDSLLVETYQTSSVLIDDARLVTGEEGYLCTFDLEFVKNNAREGLFDPKKISDRIKRQIKERFVEFEKFV